MTLGDVETSLADGVLDPQADRVTLKDGKVIENYYKSTLDVKYFQPIDKSRFALPPSGWCTWYYYYQQINENEVKQNAQWIADNLKDYGAQYVQIDDGWQGTGRVFTRDWTNVSDKFPSGMDKLAAYIKSLGLKPGIWIAPHGQSNDAVVKNLSAIFLMKPDGTSASETWEGRYLLDPSTAENTAKPSPDRAIVSPSGQRLALDSEGPDVVELAEQGFYEIRGLAAGAVPSAIVASNVDLRESDLSAIPTADVVAAATGRAGGGPSAQAELVPSDAAQEAAQRVWWYLLFAGLVLLSAETLLSNRVKL